MALGSHLITVRGLEKYIDDVIGKKANLPDTSKTIIGNISQINSDLTALLQWSNPVNNIANVPATAHDILVNTIVSNAGALGSILIPYNAYGIYIFGGWGGNYAILEYQANLFDISLYLDGIKYQHRAYTIVYR